MCHRIFFLSVTLSRVFEVCEFAPAYFYSHSCAAGYLIDIEVSSFVALCYIGIVLLYVTL